MPKRLRKTPTPDFNQVAFQVVRKATEQAQEAPPEVAPTKKEISRVMAEMGRKGGLRGGKRRLETMTPEQRRMAAFKAAKARWSKAKRRKA